MFRLTRTPRRPVPPHHSDGRPGPDTQWAKQAERVSVRMTLTAPGLRSTSKNRMMAGISPRPTASKSPNVILTDTRPGVAPLKARAGHPESERPPVLDLADVVRDGPSRRPRWDLSVYRVRSTRYTH